MKKKNIALCVVSRENLKNLKCYTFSKEAIVLPIIFIKCENQDENIFKEEKSIEILEILDLIKNVLLL